MIDVTKIVREITYNGTKIPLLGTGDNIIKVSTEAELNALLVSENIDKLVAYDGELYVIAEDESSTNTSVAVGDTIDRLYFNINVTPDLASLDWDNPDATLEGMPLFYLLNANETPNMDGMLLSFVKMGDDSYAIAVAQSGIVYTTEDGWSSESFDLTDLISQGYNTTVAYIGQSVSQTTWGVYISKEPFIEGSVIAKPIAGKLLHVDSNGDIVAEIITYAEEASF